MSEKKDLWDKLSSISSLIAGILIAGIGSVATIVYNQRQIDLQELQALERFVEYVVSEEPDKREFGYAAFVELGFENLALRIIELKGDEAGAGVVADLAVNATGDEVKARAQQYVAKTGIAGQKERAGFVNLLSGDYEAAIQSFTQADSAFPAYHNVSEIKNLLISNRDRLSNEDGRREVLTKVVTDYSWKVPTDLLGQMKNEVEK